MNERVAEIKRYLKMIPGSKFMSERRNRKDQAKGPCLKAQNYGVRKGYYKPLGQVLLERNKITQEQLDEGLVMHWKRGILLGEILKELGSITNDELEKALAVEKNLSKR